MYRVILTGATGFIGGHLLKYLGKLGYPTDYINKEEFMREDFSRLDDFQPDIVVHCAWLRNNDLHVTDHLEFAELSCNFFNECKKRGIRVINIGSSSEYGVKYKPMREDMRCEPINTYGIAKLMVTLYAKKLGFNTLRLFTVNGAGSKSFKDISEKADKYSSPSFVRDYVHVLDVVVAVERLMHAEHIYGEIINIGFGLARKNVDVASGKGKWFSYPQRQYEPTKWVADITKMGRLLNL